MLIAPLPGAAKKRPTRKQKERTNNAKMKTHRGTAKRFRVTGSGKIMRRRLSRATSSPRKSQKRKRNLRNETEL